MGDGMGHAKDLVVDGHLHVSDRVHPQGGSLAALGGVFTRMAETLQASHVDGTVLVASSPMDTSPVEAARLAPDHIAAVGVIDPEQPEPLQHVKSWLDEGAAGIRMMSLSSDGIRPHRVMPSLLETLETAHSVLWAYLPCQEWELLRRLAVGHPSLSIVVNHLGLCHDCRRFPGSRLTPFLDDHRRTYVVVSGMYAYSNRRYPHSDLHGWARALRKRIGASRLLWASDHPWGTEQSSHADQLRLIGEIFPDMRREERDSILGGTVQSLLHRSFDVMAPGGWTRLAQLALAAPAR